MPGLGGNWRDEFTSQNAAMGRQLANAGRGAAGGLASAAMGANPLLSAAGGALSALGGLADLEMKKRQYQLGKQQQNQGAYMDFTNAINDQRQRAARTPGLEALMTQMAQRLGVNLPMQRAKELEIKPVSGNYGVDKTFADQYGGQYADDYARNLAAGAKPKAAAPRMSPTMSLMQNMLMGMGRRNA